MTYRGWRTIAGLSLLLGFGVNVGRNFPRRTDYVVHTFVHDDAGATSVAGRIVNVNDGGPIAVCDRLEWRYGVPSCQCDVHPLRGD